MAHRYTSSEELIYPYARIGGATTALTAAPGMAPVEFDEAPDDGRWEQLDEEPKRSAKKAAPEAAKAVEE